MDHRIQLGQLNGNIRFSDPSFGASAIDVVAAVIERDGQFLVCRRPDHKRHPGMWEFPGGKLLDGESFEDAARRELREELRLDVVRVGPPQFSARDPDSPFEIHFLTLEAEGEPQSIEHDEIRWCTPEELQQLPLAPADSRFVQEVLTTDG